MFVAFLCLERFSKFPALWMGRIDFVSARLGSKQHALAPFLWRRRNDSEVGVHRACEEQRAGHQQDEPDWAGAGAFPAPPYRTSLRGCSTGLQRFSHVPLPVALSSLPRSTWFPHSMFCCVSWSVSDHADFSAANPAWGRTLPGMRAGK